MSRLSRLHEPAPLALSLAAGEPNTSRKAVIARMALAAVSILAVVAAFHIGSERASGAAGGDAALATVIRFMVVMKASIALGVAMLVERRLRHPARRAMVTALIVATATALAGPALMWHLDDLRLGAAFYYLGLATIAVLAWLDRATIGALLAAAVARRKLRQAS